MWYRTLFIFAMVIAASAFSVAQAVEPILSDSRIKTFVYNENDVFNILTHYGYQSNVEFGKNERIQTVSVGDRVGWQIIPSGRRLFIRALEESAHTNMTVITTKRAYQFDLRSSGNVPLHPSDELVYVARFFYPDEVSIAAPSTPAPPALSPVTAMPRPSAPISTATIPPVSSATLLSQSQPRTQNFNYTYAGPDTIAPLKIYDDGSATYFKLRNMNTQPPTIFALGPNGQMQPVQVARAANGLAVVNVTAPRFALKSGEDTVTIFNENML